MTFIESLKQRWNQSRSLLCVGLDPDINRIPESIRNSKTCFYDFCTAIVDATAQYACSFKPQIAYFASRAAESELEGIIEYIHKNYPDIPVILDAKRGDIGSTAKHYAKEAFSRMASRMASEIWSQILSGWPSVTDSDVNRTLDIKSCLLKKYRVRKATCREQKTCAGCEPKAHVNAYLSVPRRNWHLTLARRLPGFIGPVPSATLDKLLF